MSDPRPTERTIFLNAIEKASAAERAAYLDAACTGDDRLRIDVEDLLAAHDRLDTVDDPAHAPTVEQSVREGPGSVIGPYKLLEPIGEGGFGVVFLAEQTAPVRRKVALKVLKAGMDTKQVVARFEAERQALALMDDAHIARVFDGGVTGSGRPYFVMELVRGVPITEFCDQNRVTPRDRLGLFVQVCQAVQHAHQKGIIHRDLKPSNVLVASHDGSPEVKVIDFGVAKALGQELTDKTLFTGLAQMVGTPLYMSPEQAGQGSLDVDTRSDIYSLGVLLYELLTGATPFDKERFRTAGYDEIRRIIREEDPPRPSTRLSESTASLPSISAQRQTEPARLTRLVRGELDWLVMKALEKDRARRYQTANAFAADVQRYLADEAVQACPPSAGYRFRKFARRNRAAVLTAGAILVALVAGSAGTTFGLIRAEHRRADAEQARSDEAAQRQVADAEKARAEAAERQTLADYRAGTDDAIEQLIGSRPELGPREKEYLEKTLKRWQAFAARQGDDERSRAIRAEGHYRVALVWSKLGQHDAARAEYEAARGLYQALAAAVPAEPRYQAGLAFTHNGLGAQLANLDQVDAARAEYEAARGLYKALAAAVPAEPRYQADLAFTHKSLGALLADLGQFDAARAEFEAARGLYKALAAAFPAEPRYQADLARTHHGLGAQLAELDQFDAARAEYEAARGLLRKLVAAFPAVPEYPLALAHATTNLGELLADLGQFDAARAENEAARGLYKALAAAFPAVPRYQAGLARTHHGLGELLADLGQGDAARAEYEAGRGLHKTLAARFPTVPQYQEELARAHYGLGVLLAGLGEREAARAEYEAARGLYKALAAACPAQPRYRESLAHTHRNLGILLRGLGECDAARPEYEAALGLRKTLAATFPAVPRYQVELGGAYCNYGMLVRDDQPADSLHWYELAIRTLTRVYEKGRRADMAKQYLRNCHWNRARNYDQLKKHAEAVRDWDKAIELSPGPEQPRLRAGRATSRLLAGMTAEAVAEVDELTRAAKWSADQWYDFACIYAVASGRTADSRQVYADRATELLRKAVDAGWKDAAHMANDADLDALRGREDFKKLLAELEARARPPKRKESQPK